MCSNLNIRLRFRWVSMNSNTANNEKVKARFFWKQDLLSGRIPYIQPKKRFFIILGIIYSSIRKKKKINASVSCELSGQNLNRACGIIGRPEIRCIPTTYLIFIIGKNLLVPADLSEQQPTVSAWSSSFSLPALNASLSKISLFKLRC